MRRWVRKYSEMGVMVLEGVQANGVFGTGVSIGEGVLAFALQHTMRRYTRSAKLGELLGACLNLQ